MRRTIYPSINEDYNAKAESIETIKTYHNTYKEPSNFLISAQFVLSILFPP